MTEVDIEFGIGPVRAIDLASLVAGNNVISGPARLMGWSVREAGFEANQEAEASVVSPAAGATIVSLSGFGGGVYVVKWTVELVGAAGAADLNNFALFQGSTQLIESLNAGAAGSYPQPDVQDKNVFGNTYAIKAIGAGTVGVTYAAQISITPSVEYGSILELRDGNSVLAEIAVPVVGSQPAWFGPQGIAIYSKVATNVILGAVNGAIYVAYERD